MLFLPENWKPSRGNISQLLVFGCVAAGLVVLYLIKGMTIIDYYNRNNYKRLYQGRGDEYSRNKIIDIMGNKYLKTFHNV